MELENHFLRLAKARTTVYEFSQKPVGEEQVHTVLEAGRWAPSAWNLQPWHFVVVRDPARIRRMVSRCAYGVFHTPPPVLIAIILRTARWLKHGHFGGGERKLDRLSYPEAYLSVGLPALNMALQAQDLGIGSCLLTPDEYETPQELGVRDPDRLVLVVGLGYEEEGAFRKKNPRRPLSEMVSLERDGGPSAQIE